MDESKQLSQEVSLRAQAWYRTSKTGCLPPDYARFIALWEALCAWYRDVEKKEHDADLLTDLKQRLGAWHANRLKDENYRAKIDALHRQAPLNRMRGSAKTARTSDIAGSSSLDQLIDFVYGVRCNLMKGGKAPKPSDRDARIVRATSEFLDEIVKHIVFSDQFD